MGRENDGWILEQSTAGDIPQALLRVQTFGIERVYQAGLTSREARRLAPPDLIVRHPVRRDEACLLAIRHPSRALTFHATAHRSFPSAAGAVCEATFRVPIRHAGSEPITVHVLKFPVDAGVAELPLRCAEWERRSEMKEGWFQVARGGYGLTLMPRKPQPGQPTLLLLHGLLSNASAVFGPLGRTDFFDRVVRASYGDRIFAYDYHSLRQSPEEAGGALLASLPAGDYQFDVIAHSSGGLVLRSVVEQHARNATSPARFHLGHGVLVACPNEGTPLGAPARWPQTISWLANLLEAFPINPFPWGWEFVAEALRWLAEDAGADIPGIRALDPAGIAVKNLQSSPINARYSALVSNYHPDPTLWQRAQDVGIDDMFDAASDLMMPSEGGWRIRRPDRDQVCAGRIGCFGPGGNLSSAATPAHHLNVFELPETVAFLSATLAGVGDDLSPVGANHPLPGRRFDSATPAPLTLPQRGEPARSETPGPPPGRPGAEADDIFQLLVLSAGEPEHDGREGRSRGPSHARIMASYRGALVMETIPLRSDKGEPKTSFGRIIGFHRRIKDYTNHSKDTLPSDEELRQFGTLLFNSLFVRDVRRLYDEALSRQRRTRLEIGLTSTIPWINEKPWEFCYDESRSSYLATEEIHFVRNVLSAVPADSIPPGDGRLRILIASTQSVRRNRLSTSEEEDAIRREFQPLVNAGLVSIDILAGATPETIHRRLEGGSFDVVHFVGHGHFDERTQEGYLLFEDPYGGEFQLGARPVREIFCRRGLSLVFLNSCESGSTGSRYVDFNLGLAQTLVAHGLPAVVANQFAVRDVSASSFARHFYGSLALGKTLGHAAREARIAVNRSRDADRIDWAVPVLYTRDAKLALCQPGSTARS